MNMPRRVCIAILFLSLFITLLMGIFAPAVVAEGNMGIAKGPNSAVLDSLLTERKFVLETLTGSRGRNRFSDGNPYATANSVSGGVFLYENVLDNYKNDPSYKALVDIWYAVHTYGDPGNLLNEFLSWAVNFTEINHLKNSINSVKEESYLAILNKAMSTDYQSTHGNSTNKESSSAEMLRSLYTGYNSVKNIYDFLSKSSGYIQTGIEEYQWDYANDFLPSMLENYTAYLGGIDDWLYSYTDKTGRKESSSLSLYELMYYERYGYDNPVMNEWRETIELEHGFAKTKKAFSVLKSIGGTASDTFFNMQIVENALLKKDSQYNLMVKARDRAGDNALGDVFNRYANIMESNDPENELNMAILQSATNTAFRYGTKYVGKKTTELAIETFPSLVTSKITGFGSATTDIAINGIVKHASTLLSTVSVVSDFCVGLTDTSEKIFEIKYLKDILNVLLLVYDDDIAIYKFLRDSGRSSVEEVDKAANVVLDDLFLIRQIHLRGIEIAYNLTVHQSDKTLIGWFDELVNGTITQEQLKSEYQHQVDALVDMPINPINCGDFVIGFREKLIVGTGLDAAHNVRVESSDSTYFIAEPHLLD
jgi:hypothetical protein